MVKEPTNKERLAAVETILSERLRVSIEAHREDMDWRKELDAKVDKILSDNTKYVTARILGEAISAHADSCVARNPGGSLPASRDLVRKYWRLIVALVGIIGGLVTILAKIL